MNLQFLNLLTKLCQIRKYRFFLTRLRIGPPDSILVDISLDLGLLNRKDNSPSEGLVRTILNEPFAISLFNQVLALVEVQMNASQYLIVANPPGRHVDAPPPQIQPIVAWFAEVV